MVDEAATFSAARIAARPAPAAPPQAPAPAGQPHLPAPAAPPQAPAPPVSRTCPRLPRHRSRPSLLRRRNRRRLPCRRKGSVLRRRFTRVRPCVVSSDFRVTQGRPSRLSIAEFQEVLRTGDHRGGGRKAGDVRPRRHEPALDRRRTTRSPWVKPAPGKRGQLPSPAVILFSEKDRHLDGFDIRQTVCGTPPGTDSAYRFRYERSGTAHRDRQPVRAAAADLAARQRHRDRPALIRRRRYPLRVLGHERLPAPSHLLTGA